MAIRGRIQHRAGRTGVALALGLGVLAIALPAGAAPAQWPPTSAWTLNGSAITQDNALSLTQSPKTFQAGTAWMNSTMSSTCLSASFDMNLGTPGAADGLTFALGDGSLPATTIGTDGGGLGFTDAVSGVGVAFDTYKNENDPSRNFVGLLAGGTHTLKQWIATNAAVPQLSGTHHVDVSVASGRIVVQLDGAYVVDHLITLSPTVRLGFTGANGGISGDHQVWNVTIDQTCGVAASNSTTIAWPQGSAWTLNGDAQLDSNGVVSMTQEGVYQTTSSAWLNEPQSSGCLTVGYDTYMGKAGGADGLVLVFADPAHNNVHTLGHIGGGLGYTQNAHPGVQDGVGVALDTHHNDGDPSDNFVGVINGGYGDVKHWLSTNVNVPALSGNHHVVATIADGTLIVNLDGTVVLTQAVNLPNEVLIGFTSSTGEMTAEHDVSGVTIDHSCAVVPAGGTMGYLLFVGIGAVVAVGGSFTYRQRRAVAKLRR